MQVGQLSSKSRGSFIIMEYIDMGSSGGKQVNSFSRILKNNSKQTILHEFVFLITVGQEYAFVMSLRIRV
jgi:hypothetical protein